MKYEVDIYPGSQVVFYDREGERKRRQVTYVWHREDGVIPLVNLGDKDTSVPHLSQVQGASGYYYRLEV